MELPHELVFAIARDLPLGHLWALFCTCRRIRSALERAPPDLWTAHTAAVARMWRARASDVFPPSMIVPIPGGPGPTFSRTVTVAIRAWRDRAAVCRELDRHRLTPHVRYAVVRARQALADLDELMETRRSPLERLLGSTALVALWPVRRWRHARALGRVPELARACADLEMRITRRVESGAALAGARRWRPRNPSAAVDGLVRTRDLLGDVGRRLRLATRVLNLQPAPPPPQPPQPPRSTRAG